MNPKVLGFSESGHCCFEYTIVDFDRVKRFNDSYMEHFILCECFNLESVKILYKALNGKELNEDEIINSFEYCELKEERND